MEMGFLGNYEVVQRPKPAMNKMLFLAEAKAIELGGDVNENGR